MTTVLQGAMAAAAPELAPTGDSARRFGGWLAPGGLYLAILAFLMVLSWQTVGHSDGLPLAGPRASFPGGRFLAGWVRWDSGWYAHIAANGYHPYRIADWSPVAFFPGYPLAMRLVGPLVGHDLLAGIAVTIASGFGSALLFWRWCADRLAPAAATTAVLTLLLYPYGYYLYGAVYADALFLVATLAGILAVERDRPLQAGLAGAVATFSRPVGVAVTVCLVLRLLERRGVLARPGWLGLPTRVRPRRLRPGDGLVLVSGAGLVMYAGYLWNRFGDPFAFSTAQRFWDQPATPHTWFKLRFFEQLADHPGAPYTWGIVLQGLLGLACLAAVPLVVRRFGWAYGIYVLLVIGVPVLGTRDFQGIGRYVLVAFPVFALAGEQLATRARRLRSAVLVASGCSLALATVGFAHGYYLA